MAASYQFTAPTPEGKITSAQITGIHAFIAMADGNKDCSTFISDWKSGASVLNADGSAAVYSDGAVIALGLTPPA